MDRADPQICVCVTLRKITALARMLVCGAPENQKHESAGSPSLSSCCASDSRKAQKVASTDFLFQQHKQKQPTELLFVTSPPACE